MTIPVLYEDDDIIVFNKPAGIVVNEAESAPDETMQQMLRASLNFKNSAESWFSLVPKRFSLEYGTPEEVFVERAGMVHRLDKDTSGIVLFAKNPGSLVNLLAQFKNRSVRKEYTALVHGRLHQEIDTIQLPIGRSTQERQRFQVTVTGRPAETEIRREKELYLPEERVMGLVDSHDLRRGRTDAQLKKQYETYGAFTLVRCHPKTGRTHQIRVHCAFLQHPLVSDYMYGGKRVQLDLTWCPRQFLHAASLEFTHPRSGEQVAMTAPLPDDLNQALTLLAVA